MNLARGSWVAWAVQAILVALSVADVAFKYTSRAILL